MPMIISTIPPTSHARVNYLWMCYTFGSISNSRFFLLGINFLVVLKFPNIPGYRTIQRIQTAPQIGD